MPSFCVANSQHGSEPHRQRRPRPVEQGARRHRRTLPDSRRTCTGHPRPPAARMPAAWAHETVRPAQPLQVIQAVRVGREPGLQLTGRPRIIPTRPRLPPIHGLTLVRSAEYPHDKKSVGEPDPAGGKPTSRPSRPSREAIGRSRGGLTSKIHLAADRRCRPISRVTSAGQRHDSLGFRPVMAGIRIRRRGPGRPRTRPDRVLGDKAYSSRAIRAYLRKRRIKATIPEPVDQQNNRLRRGRKGGRPPAFDPETYSSATSSNAPSTS